MTKEKNVNTIVDIYSHSYTTLYQLRDVYKSKHLVFGHKHILKFLSILYGRQKLIWICVRIMFAVRINSTLKDEGNS
jgi:hypothetical protein